LTIYSALLLIAAIFPLFIYIDFRNKRAADNNPDIEFDYNGRGTTFVMMFSPFVTLFYTDFFWTALLYMVPLYVYFSVLMVIANKKSWCPFSKADLFIASSGLTTTVLAYYIWFHKGILVPQTTALTTSSSHSSNNADPSIWPYYVFGILLATILISALYEKNSNSKKSGLASSLLAPVAVIFPLLPLFIESYWWGMLASLMSLILVMPIISKLLPISTRGGMSFVVSYIYMMAATLSIILYAILF